MATIRWISGAPAVAQVQNYTLAGTWEASDIIRAKIGQKSFDTTAGSTVAATIAQTFVDAWNALSAVQYPEFAEITASRSGDDIILTADVAGRPFTCSLTPLESDQSAADAQTIEGSGTATNGSTTTTSTGPNDWSTAANWSGGAVPTGSDTVYIEDSSIPILYGLAQSAVTLTALHIAASYTGQIGLPKWNAGGYAEYRDEYLAISATTLKIGYGPGAGSGRLKLNTGSNATTVDVERTAETLEPGVPSLLWKGVHASNVVNITRGYVGISFFGLDAATLPTLRVGYVTSQERDAQVVCGAGATLTTVHQTGGRLEVSSNLTTANVRGGAMTLKGSATLTTLDLGVLAPENPAKAVFYYNSSGTITTAHVRRNGTLDCSQDMRSRTITTLNQYAGSSILDPFNAVTKTIGLAAGATPGEVSNVIG